jgi:ribosomal protein S27AE
MNEKIKCPNCIKGKVSYVFTSDRWECDNCNYTNLFEPNSKEDRLNEG